MFPGPATMSPIEFSTECSRLASLADRLPSHKRGPVFREIGDLWKREFPTYHIHETWYGAAELLDRGCQ